MDTNVLPVMDTNAVPVDTNVMVTPVDGPVTPPPMVTEHVIVKGDTLYDLAKKYGVTLQALKDQNPTINPNNLQLGKKIVIPPPAPPANGATTTTTEPVAGEQVYKVQSGDNLTKIGAKFGVTAAAIRKANSLTSDRIVVGQKLKIPAKAAPAPEAAPTAPPPTTPQ